MIKAGLLTQRADNNGQSKRGITEKSEMINLKKAMVMVISGQGGGVVNITLNSKIIVI